MKHKGMKIVGLFLTLLILSACTFAGTDTSGDIPGFLMGIWHGLLAPYTLITRWFMDIQMYAVPNTGFGYDFGFLLGLLASIPIGWLAALISIAFYFLA